MIRPCRPVGIAAQRQRSRHARLAGKAGEKLVQLREARDVARRDVRHDHEARRMQPGRRVHDPMVGVARREGDIDLGPGREMGPTDLGGRGAARRDLDRIAPQQRGEVCLIGQVEVGRHAGSPRLSSDTGRT